jgi:hypothetical protein
VSVTAERPPIALRTPSPVRSSSPSRGNDGGDSEGCVESTEARCVEFGENASVE